MAQFTVIGYYADDDSPQVTGVVEGIHAVTGGDTEQCQPWATHVDAADPEAAEALARSEMDAQNDPNDEEI